jgi:hypothetical protein
MRTRSLFVTASLIGVIALLLAPAARSESKDASSNQNDTQALQGRWERKLPAKDVNAHGGARAVKEISGSRETVSYFNEAGQTVYATTADFTLQQAGPVKLYTYSNFKVTQSKETSSETPPEKVSYIYRVEGDVYYEAHGLLTTSPAGAKPRIVAWKRMK